MKFEGVHCLGIVMVQFYSLYQILKTFKNESDALNISKIIDSQRCGNLKLVSAIFHFFTKFYPLNTHEK